MRRLDTGLIIQKYRIALLFVDSVLLINPTCHPDPEEYSSAT